MRDLLPPVAAVAHDAGAANLMIGWLRDASAADIRLCVDGPARTLFHRELPALNAMPIAEALDSAGVLLSGTSRTSDLEHEARKLARARAVPSIGVVDHWVNYRSRFERAHETVLPDYIWVADEYAADRARRSFPGIPVCQKPNRYLEHLVTEIGAPHVNESADPHILYVLEPFRTTWGHGDTAGEFQALDYFVDQLAQLGVDPRAEIRLRPHPEDAAGKYAQWVQVPRTYRISVDDVSSLSDAVSWADWVVGCETYAMVVALHAGRHVLSSLPPWAPACCLPHAGIVHLRALRG